VIDAWFADGQDPAASRGLDRVRFRRLDHRGEGGMSIRTLLLIVIFIILGIFTVLNWNAFMTPMALSLVFATVEAPLGLIMLGVTAVIAVAFLAYLVYLQTTVILDTRRSARELKVQRDLADQAEASRFTELRGYIETRLGKLESDSAAEQARAEARLDQLGAEMQGAIEHAANTLAAYIGELEDRLARSPGSDGAKPVP
jgi:uncharacterized integral membrane protein